MSTAGDALRRLADRADNEGGLAAANAMGQTAQGEIKHNLSRRSHPPGTPTPSPPGQPPARISGRLQGSIMAELPSGGGGLWRSRVGPHGVVYAAIQQHGGRAGRNHASDLPPRPYLDVSGARLRISEAGSSAFYRAVFGG